jgi:protein TIF31
VIAITQGHIAAVNLMDAEEGRVYVFNNIFFSRAVDMKDTFKVFAGNEATRKSAGQDVNSQKMISALGVEGLHTGLSAIVDYKGDRWMCQSVIPGVLQSNEHSARLMYGVMDDGTRLSVSGAHFQ